MVLILNLNDYSWGDIDSLEDISIGDQKSMNFGRYGVHQLTVAGIDHFCSGSITFVSDVIAGSKMSDYAIIGGLKKADIFLSFLNDLSKFLTYDLIVHLPKIGYRYSIDGEVRRLLMNLTIPSLEDIQGEGKLALFDDEENLKSGSGWWTSSFERSSFDTVSPDGEIILSNPYDELGVRIMFTYVRDNIARLNRIGISYPDTIGDSDIIDCIEMNSSMENIDRVYYPIMFNL